jgi:chromate transporter
MIYLKLFLVFARIGLFGFGGGMAMLPMIYQGAESFELMSREDFSDLVAISQVTPGPIAVNAATYVGYHAAGVPGALVATLGVALPSFLLVLLVCYFLERFRESRLVEGAFTGIRPVTVGLIASAVVFMGQSAFGGLAEHMTAQIAAGAGQDGLPGILGALEPVDVVPVVLCAASLILIGKCKVNPIFIVIGAGVTGAVLCG